MIVFLNGQFVPEAAATVSVFDRGFLYGDGVFETIRVRHGRPFRWLDHFERWRRGAEFLQLRPPYSAEQLRAWVHDLVHANQLPEGLLRLTLTRGVGPRGYSIRGADSPTVVMALHPVPVSDSAVPPRCRLATSRHRLPAGDVLANFKSTSKLVQVLARTEAEAAGADEALLLNTDGHVAEAPASNVFWFSEGTVCTPPLTGGLLAGVTRGVVCEIAESLHWPLREMSSPPKALLAAEGVFLSNSAVGITTVTHLDGQTLHDSPRTEEIRQHYQRLLDEETRPE